MSLVQTLPTSSELCQPNDSRFTCISCQVVFPSSGLQRTHYRTDWHKYNLKRKMADLVPVTAHQFNEKVLAQQAKGQEEKERASAIHYCSVCRKSYGTEPAFENHLRSKKHKDSETQQEILSHEDTQMTTAYAGATTADDSTPISLGEDDFTTTTNLQCLFCNKKYDQFDANLHHMSKDHGFFLPDVEYLSDTEGLVWYLSKKIQSDLSCLYCNKELKSAQAAMTHMVDKGHCKMAYDDTEDVDALLQFYDFGTMTDDDYDDQVSGTKRNQHGELVLQNGTRLGNRHLHKHHKQQQRPHHGEQDNGQSHLGDHGDNDNDDASRTSSTAVMDQREIQQLQDPETLWKNRHERRHPNLAITYGQFEEHQMKTGTGILEATKKNAYQYQVGIKHNANSTRRFRTQNPI